MENKRPELNLEHSVISVVSELHSYFRDLQSYYQITKGEVLSQLEAENDAEKLARLRETLIQINKKIDYFHILNNSISTADVVLHAEEMVKEFGK